MDSISSAWLYPIILLAGVLQAWGPPMNGALRKSLSNPWLASTVSFSADRRVSDGTLWLCLPRPMPTADGISGMPWWAPLGGLIGSFAVVAGLLFVDRVGAGTFAGLTITANILMSLAIDQFAFFGVEQHSLGVGRSIGAGLMVAGIALIAKF